MVVSRCFEFTVQSYNKNPKRLSFFYTNYHAPLLFKERARGRLPVALSDDGMRVGILLFLLLFIPDAAAAHGGVPAAAGPEVRGVVKILALFDKFFRTTVSDIIFIMYLCSV